MPSSTTSPGDERKEGTLPKANKTGRNCSTRSSSSYSSHQGVGNFIKVAQCSPDKHEKPSQSQPDIEPSSQRCDESTIENVVKTRRSTERQSCYEFGVDGKQSAVKEGTLRSNPPDTVLACSSIFQTRSSCSSIGDQSVGDFAKLKRSKEESLEKSSHAIYEQEPKVQRSDSALEGAVERVTQSSYQGGAASNGLSRIRTTEEKQKIYMDRLYALSTAHIDAISVKRRSFLIPGTKASKRRSLPRVNEDSASTRFNDREPPLPLSDDELEMISSLEDSGSELPTSVVSKLLRSIACSFCFPIPSEISCFVERDVTSNTVPIRRTGIGKVNRRGAHIYPLVDSPQIPTSRRHSRSSNE
jgi:hypothetical protein